MLMAVCNHSCGSGHHDQETQARKREDAGALALLYLCRGAHARAKQLEAYANRGPRGDPLLEPRSAADVVDSESRSKSTVDAGELHSQIGQCRVELV